MRRKVNIKIPSSDLDYGKKPYGSATAYQGQVRKASSKLEHDQVIRQYSEFKRPQGNHDSYQDMEYWADPPPGFVFPDFTVPDWPGNEYPVPDFEGGDAFECICVKDECYCPGQTVCFYAGCTYPIVGAKIMGGGGKFSVTSGGKGRLCITASEDAKLFCDINIILQLLKPNGKGGIIGTGTCVVKKLYGKCKDEECCAGTEDMAWDDETSAETVARESSCVVAITDAGDGSPYTWSVSGTGFYFNAAYSQTSIETDEKVVTLYADANACGTATITVTGCADAEVEGQVRCTEGSWTGWTTTCGAYEGGLDECQIYIGGTHYTTLCKYGESCICEAKPGCTHIGDHETECAACSDGYGRYCSMERYWQC